MKKKYPHSRNVMLYEIGEFGLIKALRSKCRTSSRMVMKGIGDDCAAIKMAGRTVLMSTDMMLERIHFDLSLTSFYQLGYKVLAVNVSDIFAMGGTPRYFLLSMGIPGKYRLGDIEEMYAGIMKGAKRFGVDMVGGDTCASRSGLVLCGTLFGDASRIISRSGARPGDGIFVNGTLGDAAMGLLLLKNPRTGKKTPSHIKLIRSHLMPEPTPWRATSEITSMIDISDGLLIDVSHICEESGTGAVLYRDKIPVSAELADSARGLGLDPVQCALTGGEDYRLLFTAPPHARIKNAFRIGDIIKKGRFLVDAKGRRTTFKAEGYEHFRH